jgi:hypothetical protein
MPRHHRRTLHSGLCLRSVTAGFVCIFLIFLQRIINLIPTKDFELQLKYAQWMDIYAYHNSFSRKAM